jgi:hypothetical protein
MRTDFDQIYINLDKGIPGALLRIVLGILFVPAVAVVNPQAGLGTMTALLLAMLFAIKLFAGVSRKLAPASTLVRSHWEWRRNLARYYDSYQWRKLLWFGVGILVGGALHWSETTPQWLLGLACVVAGAVAEIMWRRHRLSLDPPAAPAGKH